MGLCMSAEQKRELQASKEIEERIRLENEEDSEKIKLLLLGKFS